MRITVFDTETTGLPKRDAPLDEQPYIIQFAAQVFQYDPLTRRFQEVDRYNQLIKPPVAIPEESTRISRISDQMVAGSPSFADVASRIISIFAGSDLVVAHNLPFDREILNYELERNGLDKNIYPQNSYDTLEGTRGLCKLPGKNGNYKAPRLMELHQFLLNESFEEAHDAEKDVEALSRCLRVLLQEGIYQPQLSDRQETEAKTTVEQASLF